jgi:hypothetical protein
MCSKIRSLVPLEHCGRREIPPNNDELCRDFSAVFRFRYKLLPEATLQNRPPDLPNVWIICASELIRDRKQARKKKKSNLF